MRKGRRTRFTSGSPPPFPRRLRGRHALLLWSKAQRLLSSLVPGHSAIDSFLGARIGVHGDGLHHELRCRRCRGRGALTCISTSPSVTSPPSRLWFRCRSIFDSDQEYLVDAPESVGDGFSFSRGIQCLHQWQKVLNPKIIKGPWTQEEDEYMISL